MTDLDSPAGSTDSAPAPGGMASWFDPTLKRLSVVVILGSVMSILDTTIVNVAIDTLAKDFHSSLSTVQWVTTGYLLSLAMVIPLSGWATERFGAKRVWITSLVVFLAGSALSGAAWSASSLIVFRVLQGLGGGMIMPVGQTILAEAAGPQRVGRVMSVLGVPMLMGPVLGPVLGGLIIDSVSWRWIFYVNVPIGVVAIAAAIRFLPRHRVAARVTGAPGAAPQGTATGAHRLDGWGVVLLSPGLALLVYGLSQAGQGSTLAIFGPIVGGLVLIVAFVLHAYRSRIPPLIDVRLFRDPTFTAASLTTFGFGAALYGAMLLLPLYYQVARGESPLSAGLLMTPQGIGAAAVMPLAGKLTDKMGAGKIVPGGLVLAVVGTVAYTQLGAHTSYAMLAFSLLVRGVGFGFVMMPAFAAAYQNLTRDQVPRASSAVNIVQRVGGSVGTALVAVVLEHQIAHHLPGTAGGLQAATAVPAAVRAHIAPALAASFGATFWWVLGLTVLSLVPGLFLPRRPAVTTPEMLEGEALMLEG